ncbi:MULTISPECIES: DUF2806 domain-containing protein [Mesorhizobium]|uniref:DUF2806 domain-containing protein n=1 Tax=Mesorhizobium TaxID=68287 RepID=UPI0010A960FA|nr:MULTISPECIES: DUF2806 domain-containing protein [Mesorhizobium]
MSGGGGLINVGDLGKAAEALINRVSDAVGGVARPWQIERVAKAEAKAEIIQAQSKVAVSDIEQRAIHRMVREEGRKQENIEAITMKSLEYLSQEAQPEKIEEDWLTHFFERSRAYSDADTRTIWAKILAGEANSPKSFSRRTIDILASMDTDDAQMFTALCSCVWNRSNDPILIIPGLDPSDLMIAGVNFSQLAHMESAGLISLETLGGYSRQGLGPVVVLTYFNQATFLKFPAPPEGRAQSVDNRLSLGRALLTRAGVQLCKVCEPQKNEAYHAQVLKAWEGQGLQFVSGQEYVEMLVQKST